MNTNWKNRPTSIDYIPEGIGRIVSIDESGTPNLTQAKKAKADGVQLPNSERHFTVAACSIEIKNFTNAKESVMNLKQKYWNDGMHEYSTQKKRVCFHSSEIRHKRGAFGVEIINHECFMSDLNELIALLPIEIFVSDLDKYNFVKQYVNPYEPYDLCMNFILERLMFSMKSDETCIVILESRGKTEDAQLLKRMKSLIDQGNNYNSAHSFSKIKGIYFNTKWCKCENDKKSYWELELADWCVYAMHKHFSYAAEDAAYDAVMKKIYNYPKINGYGSKMFP